MRSSPSVWARTVFAASVVDAIGQRRSSRRWPLRLVIEEHVMPQPSDQLRFPPRALPSHRLLGRDVRLDENDPARKLAIHFSRKLLQSLAKQLDEWLAEKIPPEESSESVRV